MRRRLRGAWFLALGGLWIACGPSAKPEPPIPIDACALLSPQDAKEIAGWIISGTASSTLEDAVGRDTSKCSYSTGSTDVPRMLSLDVRQAANADAAARRFEGGKSMLETLARAKLEEVPGLGERAIWVGGQLEQLHVLEGRFHLIITSQTGERQLDVARQVAQRALARLPKKKPA